MSTGYVYATDYQNQKRQKCFFAEQIQYLDFNISASGIRVSKGKIKRIIEAPEPVNVE